MRVLCIYPGMDITVNDNAYALTHLKDAGVALVVICSRMCNLKSTRKRARFDKMRGIPVYRLYENFAEQASLPVKHYDTVYRIARRFQPDVIFCSQQFNMCLAKKLKADLQIPIVLLVEYACDPIRLLRRRWYLGIKPLARPVAEVYWRWLARNAQAIITSFIGDRLHLQELSRYGPPVHYVPWCNSIPCEICTDKNKRNRLRGVYIGSLSKWKNTDEFAVTLPDIFEHTPVREFVVVGPGPGVAVIQRLQERYAKQITYIPSLPRLEALKLIQQSYFAYTPVKGGGWGFIGDSWGTKTPLVVTHNEYQCRDRVDALVVNRLERIHLAINELYENRGLYQKLQQVGYQRAMQEHSAKSVGDKLLQVFESAIRLWDNRQARGRIHPSGQATRSGHLPLGRTTHLGDQPVRGDKAHSIS